MNYQRRKTREVKVGNVTIGGNNPIRLQSMTNTSTMDTEGSIAQAMEIAEAGGEIVRLTTQGVREAANMANIKKRLLEKGCDVPLVADVHFNPKAAYEAALHCDKVRINPGNFVDAARTFQKLSFTDEEYADEIGKIREALLPFINLCREHSTAVRLGVNHGSLSDRIMSRYGDTPAGMVESVMEFLRIFREENFYDVVISIKASNTVVMTETVRLLVKEMEKEGMDFPIHLGVTEAGDGEDGRIKSSVGIGTLLAEGIGDTIRVSLSEHPAAEIPVARMLRDYILRREGHKTLPDVPKAPFPSRKFAGEPFGVKYPIVLGLDEEPKEEWWHLNSSMNPEEIEGLLESSLPIVLTSSHQNRTAEMALFIDRLVNAGGKNPVILELDFPDADLSQLQVEGGADFGWLLLNGYGSGISIVAPKVKKEDRDRVALGILQACRLRTSKTEYIACPGCGRTLFDLQSKLKEVKESTDHLKGLKIGVMGCIVNGPGEMADADYGYVGAGVGRVSIYKGKELRIKNIPQEEALDALIELIKQEGDWKEKSED